MPLPTLKALVAYKGGTFTLYPTRKSNSQRHKVFVSLVLPTRITVFALLCVSRHTGVDMVGVRILSLAYLYRS